MPAYEPHGKMIIAAKGPGGAPATIALHAFENEGASRLTGGGKAGGTAYAVDAKGAANLAGQKGLDDGLVLLDQRRAGRIAKRASQTDMRGGGGKQGQLKRRKRAHVLRIQLLRLERPSYFWMAAKRARAGAGGVDEHRIELPAHGIGR